MLSVVVVLTESERYRILTMPQPQVILFSAICLLFISAGSMPIHIGRLTEVRKRLEASIQRHLNNTEQMI